MDDVTCSSKDMMSFKRMTRSAQSCGFEVESRLFAPGYPEHSAAQINIMSASEIRLPYLRPRSLSDPFHDHGPDHLAALISTPDQDLKWHDYQCILGPFLPAGTYEESAYFLPLAFDYVLKNDEDALDLVTSLVWFTSEYALQLKHDSALDAARTKLKQCFTQWTGDFVIRHFDRDACRGQGWGLSYFDYIRHSETVGEATNDLIRFETHGDLALAFFTDLAIAESDAVKSAWFLECARAHLSNDAYCPPEHVQIQQLLDDQELVSKHSAIVRRSLPTYDSDATYWRDTFTILGTISET